MCIEKCGSLELSPCGPELNSSSASVGYMWAASGRKLLLAAASMATIAGGLTVGLASGASAAPGGHDTHTDPEPSTSSSSSSSSSSSFSNNSTSNERSGGDDRAAEETRQQQAQATFEVVSATPVEEITAEADAAISDTSWGVNPTGQIVEVSASAKDEADTDDNDNVDNSDDTDALGIPDSWETAWNNYWDDDEDDQTHSADAAARQASLAIWEAAQAAIPPPQLGDLVDYESSVAPDEQQIAAAEADLEAWQTNPVDWQQAQFAEQAAEAAAPPPQLGDLPGIAPTLAETTAIADHAAAQPEVQQWVAEQQALGERDEQLLQGIRDVVLGNGSQVELEVDTSDLPSNDDARTVTWTEQFVNGVADDSHDGNKGTARATGAEQGVVTDRNGAAVNTRDGGSVNTGVTGGTQLPFTGGSAGNSAPAPRPVQDPGGECVDNDGDGWGWTGTQSCRVNPAQVTTPIACVDDDGDGWGWTGTQSCRVHYYG